MKHKYICYILGKMKLQVPSITLDHFTRLWSSYNTFNYCLASIMWVAATCDDDYYYPCCYHYYYFFLVFY